MWSRSSVSTTPCGKERLACKIFWLGQQHCTNRPLCHTSKNHHIVGIIKAFRKCKANSTYVHSAVNTCAVPPNSFEAEIFPSHLLAHHGPLVFRSTSPSSRQRTKINSGCPNSSIPRVSTTPPPSLAKTSQKTVSTRPQTPLDCHVALH